MTLSKPAILIVLCCFSYFQGCIEPCEEPLDAYILGAFSFELIDQDSGYHKIVKDPDPEKEQFHIDSVKFLDDQLIELRNAAFELTENDELYTLSVSLFYFSEDEEPYKDGVKDFYLQLTRQDLDTFQVNYLFREKDCGDEMVYMNVFYNGEKQKPIGRSQYYYLDK